MTMRFCVIDGRGGGLGKRLIQELHDTVVPTHEIIALGMNEAAAAAMKHAGASQVWIGERAIRQTLPTADVILASLNVVLPGSMLGEVTPGIAEAVLKARARKLLLPLNRERVEIMGTDGCRLERVIEQTIQRIRTLLQSTALI